ncbi:hypothetical protein HMI01_06100 [Halolactibacillus miurensis]|uniref:Uncharacterized protein n=1 Tax=Halolactibacillus miurensis TaxID=306541 RepID=A0A1I6R2Y5_9BACI|nr:MULTISPECIES: hypothetical protein [Halolactibacillus]GEM03622.1 hypothetical protein HMI01_06100 [Halolactibacillus miurensis]SFS59046.1 hypothetical protein SAMN05421668_10565 [Halolactibacillus miurensis]
MLPEAILLGPLVIKATLIVTILGLLGGALFFYYTSPHDKALKKIHSNKILDGVLYTMIFTIVAKVILNLPLFIDDPVAVLAYPSGSSALYLALVGVVGVLAWSLNKEAIRHHPFMDSLFRFIVGSQFVQLFLTLTVTTYHVSIYQLGLLFITLLLLVLLTKTQLALPKLIGLIAFYSVTSFGLYFIETVPFFSFYVNGSYYLVLGFLLIGTLVWSQTHTTESR